MQIQHCALISVLSQKNTKFWNNQSDQLIFDLSAIDEAEFAVIPTKRSVISFISRFYDPIGFMSLVLIRFKVLMQELCKSQLSHLKVVPGLLCSKFCLLYFLAVLKNQAYYAQNYALKTNILLKTVLLQ